MIMHILSFEPLTEFVRLLLLSRDCLLSAEALLHLVLPFSPPASSIHTHINLHCSLPRFILLNTVVKSSSFPYQSKSTAAMLRSSADIPLSQTYWRVVVEKNKTGTYNLPCYALDLTPEGQVRLQPFHN